MSDRDSKSKEEMIIELYIKDIIDETQYYEMMRRIRAGK